ncbi:MAG: cation:proton antiporter [Thermodesulfobacteriota bacterium]
MELHFLRDIVVICGLAMVVVFVCHRLRIPTIIGFLLTGVVAGPHGLGLVADAHQVEALAELGVVLLLFTIGLEFSVRELNRMRTPILVGGAMQVAATLAAAAAAALFMGLKPGPAVFIGFLAALSSTAIVLKLLQEKAEVDSAQGRAVLAILIFQDVIAVVMLLAAPLLSVAGGQQAPGWGLALKGLVVLAVLAAGYRWAAPRLLNAVAGTRSRELFTVTIAALLLGVAWLTAWAGLSLALGAFAAGLIVAESRYSHQTIGSVLPLRDLFTSLFFVSVGMLLDLGFLARHPEWVAVGSLLVLAGKTLLAGAAALLLRYPLRVALAVGLMLSQVGEFSFVLARAGLGLELISQQTFQLILVVSVVTMLLTPLMVSLGSRVARRAPPGWLAGHARSAPPLEGHLVVVGYGINGRNVARAAQAAGIPYLVVEMNPATVREEQARGEPIIYGDAVNPAVLEHAGLARAKALAVALADPVATRRVVATARSLHPGLYIIARTRFLQEMETLAELGADEVIPEEYETAVEIFARVLRRFFVPQEEIEALVAQLRAEGYEMLRQPVSAQAGADLSRFLSDVSIATVRVQAGSAAAGATIGELGLRRGHGLTVLAVRRGEQVVSDPGADTGLEPGDLLVLMAKPEHLARGRDLFRA